MKIVIEIDENAFTKLFDNGLERYPYPYDALAWAARHGVVLPKGHGRLIDEKVIETEYMDLMDREIEHPTIQVTLREIVNEMPTVIPADKEAEKQVTGRWIRKMDAYRGGYVECSVCGTPYKYIDPKKMKTCMICHARMEESE